MSSGGAGAGWGLAKPTIADLRAGVLRAARGDDTVWAAVCQAAGAMPYTGSADDVHDRLVRAAKERGGAVRVAAISFEVRLRNYDTLTALQAARNLL